MLRRRLRPLRNTLRLLAIGLFEQTLQDRVVTRVLSPPDRLGLELLVADEPGVGLGTRLLVVLLGRDADADPIELLRLALVPLDALAVSGESLRTWMPPLDRTTERPPPEVQMTLRDEQVPEGAVELRSLQPTEAQHAGDRRVGLLLVELLAVARTERLPTKRGSSCGHPVPGVAEEVRAQPELRVLARRGDELDQLDLVLLATEVRIRVELDRGTQIDQRLIEPTRMRMEGPAVRQSPVSVLGVAALFQQPELAVDRRDGLVPVAETLVGNRQIVELGETEIGPRSEAFDPVLVVGLSMPVPTPDDQALGIRQPAQLGGERIAVPEAGRSRQAGGEGRSEYGTSGALGHGDAGSVTRPPVPGSVARHPAEPDPFARLSGIVNPSRTYVVVGGVAGGASCAARLRRLDEHARIIVLERGPYVSFANCGLPYYIGGVIEDESKLLVATAEMFVTRYDIDVRPENEALSIDRGQQQVRVRRKDGTEYALDYDALVLSPGARPIRPPLPGIDAPGIFSIRTVPDSRAVRAWIDEHEVREAVVIGGGFIGIEMAENLHRRGIHVHLVEMAPQVMPPFDPDMAAHMQQRLQERGVAVYTGHAAKEFTEVDGRLSVETDHGRTIACDLVILAIGVQPESQLARDAGLALGPKGHVHVDPSMATEDPYIWAIGDAVEVADHVRGMPTAVPLAGPANRQGRIAADSIVGRDVRFRGVQGTAVCGAFDLTMACTGANERTLRNSGVGDFAVVETHPTDHVTYYPGAHRFHLKLIYARSDGRILGAQAVGEGDVARRIDVISMAIQLGGTVEDLADAELCYAPQFGAAKDPVNMAGMVASNERRGDLRLARGWDELRDSYERAGPHPVVIDVREASEFESKGLPGSLNVPLSQLRDRLGEIPRDRPVFVTCGVGQRAWNACRCLDQNGFDARLLSGGFQSYEAHLLARVYADQASEVSTSESSADD